MVVKKIKVSKKASDKLPDALSLSERWDAWTQKNFKFLIAGVVVLLVASGILWGINSYKGRQESAARSDYAVLFGKWPAEAADAKEWEAFVPQLEEFIGKHDGTNSALNAKTDLARVYIRLNRFQDAVVWSGKVLGEVPPKNPLKPIAHEQLAVAYEALGKSDEAMDQWKALKAEGFEGYNRIVYWNLARLYAQKKDNAKAAEQYELAVKAQGVYPSAALLESELAKIQPASDEKSNAGAAKDKS